MIRKNFWVFITVIAVLLIIIATVSGVYNSLNKKSVTLSAETTTSEQKNNNNDESSESAEPSDETEESSVPEKYIVQEGDSLWGIAQEFQTSVDAIKELNGLTDDGLMLGQELLIPSPGADQSVERTNEDLEALSSRGVDDNGMYSVQEGDSLWSIAARCGTSVAKIKELNNLTGARQHSLGRQCLNRPAWLHLCSNNTGKILLHLDLLFFTCVIIIESYDRFLVFILRALIWQWFFLRSPAPGKSSQQHQECCQTDGRHKGYSLHRKFPPFIPLCCLSINGRES
jgi:LysM repeat protein